MAKNPHKNTQNPTSRHFTHSALSCKGIKAEKPLSRQRLRRTSSNKKMEIIEKKECDTKTIESTL
jgi:hypothetical protein